MHIFSHRITHYYVGGYFQCCVLKMTHLKLFHINHINNVRQLIYVRLTQIYYPQLIEFIIIQLKIIYYTNLI